MGLFPRIFTDNPVLEREVRGRLRLRRKGGGRAGAWLAGGVGLFALYFYARGLAAVGHGTVQDARDLWPLLAYGALTLIVLLAPALASTAITQEREQQTWEALTATRLSASEVLLGKWLGRQMILWLLLTLLLPFWIACCVRGQLGPGFLLLTLLFLLATTGCYSALGLLCSFQARRTVAATASALTVAAFVCIGTPIIDSLIQNLEGRWNSPNTPLMWANPFFALAKLMNGFLANGQSPDPDIPAIVVCYFLFALAAAAAMLAFMVRRYRHAVRERS